jgi:hypothetical protein
MSQSYHQHSTGRDFRNLQLLQNSIALRALLQNLEIIHIGQEKLVNQDAVYLLNKVAERSLEEQFKIYSELVSKNYPEKFRLQVNYYTKDDGQVVCAIGWDPHITTHDKLHLSFKERYPNIITSIDLDTWVSGFLDKRNNTFSSIVVRIEDHDLKSKNLDFILKNYRTTINAIEDMANKNRFQTSILPVSPSSYSISEVIGKRFLILNEDLPAHDYYNKITQVTELGECFYSGSGPRYIAPIHISQLFSLVDKKKLLLNRLTKIYELTNPENKKIRDYIKTKEYHFLMYDNNKKTFKESPDDEAALRDSVQDIIYLIRNRNPSNYFIKANLQSLLDFHKYHCGGVLAGNNIYDSEYLSLIQERLGDKKKINDNLDYQVFSTAMKALELGYLDFKSKSFCFTTINREHILCAQYFIGNYWSEEYKHLSLFESLKQPLTYEQHPAKYVKRFEDPENKSIILIAGDTGEHKERKVFRPHPLAPLRWQNATTSTMKELAKAYLGQEIKLTELVTFFMQSQINLMNQMYSNLPSDSFTLPNYLQANLSEDSVYLVRDYIPGIPLSKEKRHLQSAEKFVNRAYRIGQLSTVNLISGRPVFSDHDLLNTDPKNDTIIAISSAESFSDAYKSINIKNNFAKDKYLLSAKKLYSAVLFKQLVSYKYSKEAFNNSANDINEILNQIKSRFLLGFEDTYNHIVNNNLFDSIEIRKHWQEKHKEYKILGLTIHEDFDLLRYLSLSDELAKLQSSDIRELTVVINEEAQRMIEWYDNIVKDKNDSTPENHENLINAFYALSTNHLPEKNMYRNIRRLLVQHPEDRDLYKAVNFNNFSIQQCTWLINIADVCAWIREVHQVSAVKLKELVLTSNNSDEFASIVNEKIPGAYLSFATAKRFYEAITNLTVALSDDFEIEEDHKLRTAIRNCSWGELDYAFNFDPRIHND